VVLTLSPIAPGREGRRPATGAEVGAPTPPFGSDVDFTGCDLVFATDGSSTPRGSWPTVLVSRGDAPGEPVVVDFAPDPLAGRPAPVDHPSWPIFVENVVDAAHGRPGPAGYRVQEGLLDPRASRLGRDVAPFDPAWLDGVPTEREPQPTSLRSHATVAALLALALLWATTVLGARRRVP
jgi:hypothetical protein